MTGIGAPGDRKLAQGAPQRRVFNRPGPTRPGASGDFSC